MSPRINFQRCFSFHFFYFSLFFLVVVVVAYTEQFWISLILNNNNTFSMFDGMDALSSWKARMPFIIFTFQFTTFIHRIVSLSFRSLSFVSTALRSLFSSFFSLWFFSSLLLFCNSHLWMKKFYNFSTKRKTIFVCNFLTWKCDQCWYSVLWNYYSKSRPEICGSALCGKVSYSVLESNKKSFITNRRMPHRWIMA